MERYYVGMRVVIDHYSRSCYSKYDIIGKEGVITRLSNESVGVSLDNIKNTASGYGVFWMRPKDFHVIGLVEENEMSKNVLRGFDKVALVTIGNSNYAYALYNDGVEYNVGDTVMVSGTYHNPVKIEHILLPDDPKLEGIDICSEVICKLDYSAYNKRVADRERVKELLDEMDKKIREIDKLNKYEVYAQSNPEIAAMLKEVKELNI